MPIDIMGKKCEDGDSYVTLIKDNGFKVML